MSGVNYFHADKLLCFHLKRISKEIEAEKAEAERQAKAAAEKKERETALKTALRQLGILFILLVVLAGVVYWNFG